MSKISNSDACCSDVTYWKNKQPKTCILAAFREKSQENNKPKTCTFASAIQPDSTSARS